jgi:uncharacterized protein YaaN involved in tellurite resistance
MALNDLAAPFRYSQAQAEKKAAYEHYNYASAALELATIKERFAELYSQWDPVNKIKDSGLEEREKLCASAYYILYGRLPEEDK